MGATSMTGVLNYSTMYVVCSTICICIFVITVDTALLAVVYYHLHILELLLAEFAWLKLFYNILNNMSFLSCRKMNKDAWSIFNVTTTLMVELFVLIVGNTNVVCTEYISRQIGEMMDFTVLMTEMARNAHPNVLNEFR